MAWFDAADGVVCLHTPAEGIAVWGEQVVVMIKTVGDELEYGHLVGRKTINHAFLTSTHLVDHHFPGNTQALTPHNLLCQVKILLLLHISVGGIELMPVETTLHQSVIEEILPGLLLGQLGDDAFHDEKKKKGKDFESAKLLITRGYLVLSACKTIVMFKAASIAGTAVLYPLFL